MMEVVSSERDGFILVELHGSLDEAENAALTPPADEGPEKKPVILDLSGVDFINSCGLGALFHYFDLCQKSGRRLALAAPSPFQKKIFKLVFLDRIVAIGHSVDGAMEILQGDHVG